VLEYFDAYLIGLTATPNKQTFGFFNQNLVMEYGHEQAVADGVNVNYDVYRIRTEVTEAGQQRGGRLLAGRCATSATRARRDWQLDDDFEYAPEELDRSVQTPDQIRTIARTLRDRWQTDLFPQRQELPKTLVFAKDDNHAEDIVRILREEFGRGNEFAQKITYRTTGSEARGPDQGLPHQLLPAHRRHRRHDRHRHRHQAGRDRRVHAQREEPQLLRADEGPRRARHQATTTCAA
jgi:type I restriction enzyme R subunit